MREIEFRGKRKSDGKWLYGDLSYGGPENNHKKFANINIWEDGLKVGYVVKQETIGQYTGLKDKNGKKIFERDILHYDGGGIYEVIFDEMMIMCPYDNIEMTSPGYYGILIGDKTKELCPLGDTQIIAKVIGNIYDNPELLEDK